MPGCCLLCLLPCRMNWIMSEPSFPRKVSQQAALGHGKPLTWVLVGEARGSPCLCVHESGQLL